jgi:hypothetical protein
MRIVHRAIKVPVPEGPEKPAGMCRRVECDATATHTPVVGVLTLDGGVIEIEALTFVACAAHAAEITSSMIISVLGWAGVEQAVGLPLDQTQASLRWVPIQIQ